METTQEKIKDLAISYAKTQVVRGINLPVWDDETEKLVARYFIAGYNQSNQDNHDSRLKDLVDFLKYYKSTAVMSFESNGENLDLSMEQVAEKYIKLIENQ